MISELSIIIPTLNEEKYLPILLKSLTKQTILPAKLQIIIVDGSSQDNTLKVAEEFSYIFQDFQILKSARGIGKQRNQGAKQAKYKYILFLDADMRLSINFFSKLLKQTVNDKEEILATTLILPDGKNFLDYITQVGLYIAGIYTYFFDPFTTGGLTFTTKKVHEGIKGFNERIIFGEDLEYGRRARSFGARFKLFFSIYAFHSPRRMRELGRFNLFSSWLQAYIYMSIHGNIYNKEIMKYQYGRHK